VLGELPVTLIDVELIGAIDRTEKNIRSLVTI
jgi:hypothetical protein